MDILVAAILVLIALAIFKTWEAVLIAFVLVAAGVALVRYLRHRSPY